MTPDTCDVAGWRRLQRSFDGYGKHCPPSIIVNAAPTDGLLSPRQAVFVYARIRQQGR
jgi:hypothetical protein